TGIKLEPSDFEKRIHLDEISKLLRDIDPAKDPLLFVQQMVSLSELLSSFDRNTDDSFPSVDENAQDPSYFIAAYFDTKSLDKALWIYWMVRSLTRYILFSDRLHETGNDRYAMLAKQARKSITDFLQS